VVATASGQVTADGATVSMTITGGDWAALTSTSGASQIEIAATNTLRAAVWDGPVMPMPAWLLQNPSRGSTTQFPVIQRESFASLSAFAASLQAGESRAETLLQIHDLYLAASNTSATNLLTGYKAAPFVEPRSGFAYFRNRWYDRSTGTFLSPDPMGYADSSNLYSFAKGDPVNNSDPTGELCERANADGWWDFAKRCGQDIGWVAGDTASGMYHPENTWKNAQRAAGGVKSTAKLVGGAVRTIAWDLPTASFNDAAADRLVAGGQAIGNFVSHPIDTTVRAHQEMAANVLYHEQRGELVASGEAAASQAQTDFLVAYSAYTLGSGAITRLRAPVVSLEGSYTASWFADNPMLRNQPLGIQTPFGVAWQASSLEALAARSQVQQGATMYRLGTMGQSAASEGQFWSLEHPMSPGYAGRYGLPPQNVLNADFIEASVLRRGAPFVTRPAPAVGVNPGGGIEVVVDPYSVMLRSFTSK
jgi:RHS repeat-associated protein